MYKTGCVSAKLGPRVLLGHFSALPCHLLGRIASESAKYTKICSFLHLFCLGAGYQMLNLRLKTAYLHSDGPVTLIQGRKH